jgi:bifunctional non-homologous end joining protein LigD
MKRSDVARRLQRYRLKRDFVRTPEPSGQPGSERPAKDRLYVIQKHAATRLHYDFRLELDGTLKSWAVPKGPSLDPVQKRLAVHVEDHPLDYADFEGIIPPRQYGAGTVLVWDRGTWQPIGNPHEGYRRGILKFRLDGQKLHGAWTLVRMHPRGGSDRSSDNKDHWLLIKERDDEARGGRDADIVERSPASVASGRQLDEVASAQPRVWQSSRSSPHKRRTAHDAPLSPARSATSPDRRLKPNDLPGAVKASQPERLSPQLATLVETPPVGAGWIHEIKYDGYRILCRIRDGKVHLFTRSGHDWTAKLELQARAVSSLGLANAWLDGEVVIFTEDGKTSFQALQNAFDANFSGRIVYCLFDVPYLNGYDLRFVPLLERKRLLASLLEASTPARRGGSARERPDRTLLRYSDHIVGEGETSLKEACRRGLEGLIAKRADSVYRSGRSRTWLKIKCSQRQEFVIGGFTEPAGSRSGLGALLIGYHDQGRFRYAGRVGTGFSTASLRMLRRKLAPLEQPRPAFEDPPTGHETQGVHWVKPRLVAEVRFSEWTEDGLLRHPSFQGLRTDKEARAIERERPAPNRDAAESAAAKTSSSRRQPAASALERVRLTHPDRVLYPDVGLTKRDLARYYESIADRILPHLRGRPLTLVRCPRGYQSCFYQKHVNERMPAAIGRVEITENGDRATYMTADSLDALLGLVQMDVLELHTWGATRDRLDRPDRLTFDLDPDPTLPWIQVVEAAQLMHELLRELGLVCFLKTTGGRGLHLVTPIQRSLDWEEAKGFAKSVADHMATTIPQRFTSVMAKRERKGKVFIDYLRNGRGATAIAAYSPRARAGAPISVPMAWDELTPRLKSDQFTLLNIADRLTGQAHDPWKSYERSAKSVTNAMKSRLWRR